VRKGQVDLLRAVARLDTPRPIRLELLGFEAEPGRREALSGLAPGLGLADVDIPGPMTGADKEARLASAHCFCLPSYDEGLHMSMLEVYRSLEGRRETKRGWRRSESGTPVTAEVPSMLIKRACDIPPSEITPKKVYLRRREFLRAAALAGVGATLGGAAVGGAVLPGHAEAAAREPIPNLRRSRFSTDEPPTSLDDITSYNNFYELGTDKSDPKRNAERLRPRPWTVRVDGECARPGEIGIEEVLSGFPQEERVYRLRCVEAWSMVVPWVGFPLGDLLRRFEPTSKARYVAFETLYDPGMLPGQKRAVLDWPYCEGLRMDEAMHPLTLLATGLYGEVLPNQNGAPLRLVVPWKYGFKSIKSIVRISFTEQEPPTSWNRMQPREYGFYANVNPEVDHPRWSQKSHRMIGDGLFARKRPTLMFNGYADQVAQLYSGMDLATHF
jgi:sulfoxide reductase catalytic subunit YedY